MNRKSQKAIFVLIGPEAFAIAADPANPLFPLINAVSLAGPRPDPRDKSRYIFIPGSDNNSPNDGSIESTRYEAFLATVPLVDGDGRAGAVTLQALDYVDFEYYPFFLRLTDAQYNAETPAYLPRSVWPVTNAEGEQTGTRQATWAEWLARGGNPAIITGSTDRLCGDMAAYGPDVSLAVAAQLIADGFTVIDRATRLTLTTE